MLTRGLFAASVAHGQGLPPYNQPRAARLFLMCSVTTNSQTANCRFEDAIVDSYERLKAGYELGYIDAHPAVLSGAAPGTEVETLVRLEVDPSRDHKGFLVKQPEDLKVSPGGPSIDDPLWVHGPTGPWVDMFIPDRAQRANVSGKAVVQCVATMSGTFTNCWVQAENPKGYGFGAAGMMLMQRLQLKPLSAGGAPVAGRPLALIFEYGRELRVSLMRRTREGATGRGSDFRFPAVAGAGPPRRRDGRD